MEKMEIVFHALSNYHENIKLMIELNPSKLLDIQLINVEAKYITKGYRKKSKILMHWSSKIPKRYNRITITTDLHRAQDIQHLI